MTIPKAQLHHCFQIIMRGTVGGGQGDIALDDFAYSIGICQVSDGSEYHTMLLFFRFCTHLVNLMQWIFFLKSVPLGYVKDKNRNQNFIGKDIMFFSGILDYNW